MAYDRARDLGEIVVTQILLLGRVQLVHEVVVAKPGPMTHKTMHLMALLAAHVNQAVRVEDCVSELWPVDPPKSAVSTLQTYVSYMRGLLVGSEVDVLSRSKSYLLSADHAADVVDLYAFEMLARNVMADDARLESALSALRQWRGVAFANLNIGPILATVATRLDERRRAVLAIAYGEILRSGHPPAPKILDELYEAGLSYVLDERLLAAFQICTAQTGLQPSWTYEGARWRENLESELGPNLGVGLGRVTEMIESLIRVGKIGEATRLWLRHYG